MTPAFDIRRSDASRPIVSPSSPSSDATSTARSTMASCVSRAATAELRGMRSRIAVARTNDRSLFCRAMIIRKLGWAGLEVEADGQRLVIDPLLTLGDLEQFVGPPLTPL